MYQSSHARWSAVSQRDPAAHCSFIYGVKTTRIYCRPTCTARLARRANVVYYDTTEQARRDGFRACQRCKPDDVAFFGQREEIVLSAIGLLRTKQNDATMSWSLKELANELGVTPSYLCRVFKKTMGTTIGEYMRQFEMQTGEASVEGISQSPDTTGSNTASSGAQPVTPVSLPVHSPRNSGDNLKRSRDEPVLFPGGTCIAESRTAPAAHRMPATVATTGSSACIVDPLAPYPLCTEEVIDLNFDFDEWIWTEGFDFNGSTSKS